MCGDKGENHQVLLDLFIRRKENNPHFSLRAFARHLSISPAQLSQLISGKRNLTPNLAVRILERIKLSPLERQRLLKQVNQQVLGTNLSSDLSYQLIEEDRFKLISEWYHFAILSLSGLKDNQANSKWISDRLGIDPLVARDAFDRLKRLGLVSKKSGKFKQTSIQLHTTRDIPSEAIRRYHQQNLALASQKLDEVDLQFREFSSITFSFSLKNMPKVKQMIHEFKNALCLEAEVNNGDEVYTLGIQFFPVTSTRRGHE